MKTPQRVVEVILPDEPSMGPAMKELPNDRWRRFVILCNQPTATGEVNYAQAAEDAGFIGSRNTLAVTAHRLAHDERIQAAMLEESRRRIGAALPIATAAVIQILTHGKNTERLKAAALLMNRGGLPEVHEQNIIVSRQETPSERIDSIMRLCKELNLDPKDVLGNIGVTVPQLEAKVSVADEPVSNMLDEELADFFK